MHSLHIRLLSELDRERNFKRLYNYVKSFTRSPPSVQSGSEVSASSESPQGWSVKAFY